MTEFSRIEEGRRVGEKTRPAHADGSGAGKRALIIVDVQNDFCEGGALGVPEGDKVVPVLNEYARRFHERGWKVLASRDWHPEQSAHFRDGGGPWPRHCVRDTSGAEFHPDLRLPEGTAIISKGVDEEEHGYSCFDGTVDGETPLLDYLRQEGVEHLYVGGLATDYCVKQTVLDGLRQNFQVTLLLDAVRGVDVEEGDSARAVDRMIRAGAKTATLETLMEDSDADAQVASAPSEMAVGRGS